MGVAASLTTCGGCATWTQLRRNHTDAAIRAATRRGEIVKVARGRYAMPTVSEHRLEALRRSAVSSHLSAATDYGWPVVRAPEVPWVTVPRHRRVDPADRVGVRLHWATLPERDLRCGVTSPLRTVLDCARALPFPEALAVADSALRSGQVTQADLRRGAAALRGPGVRGIRRVAELADGRAANPLESALRAAVADVPGTAFVPQWTIAEPGIFAVADLADPGLGLILEAEGYAAHGSRDAWRADARRFTGLAAYGWSVLRFPYEDVIHHPDQVRWAVTTWLAERSRTAGMPRQSLSRSGETTTSTRWNSLTSL